VREQVQSAADGEADIDEGKTRTGPECVRHYFSISILLEPLEEAADRSGRRRVGSVQRQRRDVGPAMPRRNAGDAATKSVRLRPMRLHRRRA
jgi:hypothetical protein